MAYSATDLKNRYLIAMSCIADKVVILSDWLEGGNKCSDEFRDIYLANAILKRVAFYIQKEPECVEESTLDSLFLNLEYLLGGKFPPKGVN